MQKTQKMMNEPPKEKVLENVEQIKADRQEEERKVIRLGKFFELKAQAFFKKCEYEMADWYCMLADKAKEIVNKAQIRKDQALAADIFESLNRNLKSYRVRHVNLNDSFDCYNDVDEYEVGYDVGHTVSEARIREMEKRFGMEMSPGEKESYRRLEKTINEM